MPDPPTPGKSCNCGNITVNATFSDQTAVVPQSDIVIQYPELSATVPLDAHALTRSSSTSKVPESSSSSPSPPSVKKLFCTICREVILTFKPKDNLVTIEWKQLGDTSTTRDRSPVLHLVLPQATSLPTLGLPPSILSSPRGTCGEVRTFLAPISDPFFLPPPFTPNSDYFRDLAGRSVTKIESLRDTVEQEIREVVEEKKAQVEQYENDVRAEVERVWKAYEMAQHLKGETQSIPSEQPARGIYVRQTSFGSTIISQSMPGGNSFASTSSSSFTRSSPSPIQISTGFDAHSSLLSASINANHFVYPGAGDGSSSPPAAPSPHLLDNPITAPFHRPKNHVDLDVVSSLRVSNMPQFDSVPAHVYGSHMDYYHHHGQRRPPRLPPIVKDADDPAEISLSPPAPIDLAIVDEVEEHDRNGHDDVSLNPFGESTQPSAASSYQREAALDDEERTPRTRTIKDIGMSSPIGEDVDRHAGRKKVTFEEPSRATSQGETEPGGERDTVFDFEDHEPLPVATQTPDASIDERIESKLIQLVAGDAPSHRAAWRNNKEKLWEALGRTSPTRSIRRRSSERHADETKLSVYASSMPIKISNPMKSEDDHLDFQPKTSLTEESGVLVPPLKKVMNGGSPRHHHPRPALLISMPSTIPEDVTVSLVSPSIPIPPAENEDHQGARDAASVGAQSHRDRGMASGRDPGPTLESLGDDDDDDDDEEDEDEDEELVLVPPGMTLAD